MLSIKITKSVSTLHFLILDYRENSISKKDVCATLGSNSFVCSFDFASNLKFIQRSKNPS